MTAKKLSAAKLEQLCRMQAEAVLSVEAMGQKLSLSVPVVERHLAKSKVQRRVDQLSREFRTAGQRLILSRFRWVLGRLLQLGSRDDETGRKALVDLLKLALAQSTADQSKEPFDGQEHNNVTEALTKHWTENEWNVFAKLLAGGGEQLPATQTEE
ncbi:MAG: hypothetical protein GWP14_09635 [Actinobacteria bacterium]|nr:hypothetical protein [Actinomycetota bacterium]